METKINTIDEIKELFLQTLINKVDGKVTKVSINSVLNGIAYGVAKVCQKEMKDSALIESELFPEYAYGKYLDKVVERSGVVRRREKQGSSVFIRIISKPSTVYRKDIVSFSSTSGFRFLLENDFTVDISGIGYAKLKSIDVGVVTNIEAESITQINGAPSGHIFCINEIAAEGGSDLESDKQLLDRLLQEFNNFALDTLSKIKGIAAKYNSLILDIRKVGFSLGVPVLGVITSNGTQLTLQELSSLTDILSKYISLSDFEDTTINVTPNIILKNMDVRYIDIDIRIDFDTITEIELRREIQIKVSKFFDYTTWKYKDTVEWEDLFHIVRGITGVRSVPEQYFLPREDILLSKYIYPRLRGLVIRNLEGKVISSSSSVIPVYYPDYTNNVYKQVNTKKNG